MALYTVIVIESYADQQEFEMTKIFTFVVRNIERRHNVLTATTSFVKSLIITVLWRDEITTVLVY